MSAGCSLNSLPQCTIPVPRRIAQIQETEIKGSGVDISRRGECSSSPGGRVMEGTASTVARVSTVSIVSMLPMQDNILALPSLRFAPTGYPSACNIPVPLTSLIGREQEVVALSELLKQPDARLVTLTGPGGVGKTHLGLQVSNDLFDDFLDGVCFIPLASISDPDLVLPTIAHELGLKEFQNQSMLDFLKAALRHRHMLLLLDN